MKLKLALAAWCWLGAACERGDTRTLTVPAGEVREVLLQCWRAPDAAVVTRAGANIAIAGRPALQGVRVHGPEPDWRTMPASAWPLAWEARREGGTLVLSSQEEARFPHYRYVLEEVTLTVPPGVAVRRSRQPLAVKSAPAR